MSFRAEIQLNVEEAKISVPISAVQSEGDEHFVWIYDESGLKKQQVSLGLASDTHQVITEGLESGTKVVTGPARSMTILNEQSVVNVKES
ncbi:hypothetical protein CS022_21860 [Veronia nyctiphanis]|uniref:CzcB-like C-terminal circularly permuted SH3-like domain-containing protein n=1 Tax=Veronia nyctiphanis TaxID=1278244 RepID=A0A4Q0YK12_9GAMM|nr:hypothetical protein [Veronia nyctiphanis]RXJ71052.1 hypothetical protein CS022_21860 [Veronia nyctiphanis]